ncbi:MAG: hypothetical protein Ct9H300mP23_03010 [Nitrospinota bacterium]|nr:MAG: hypothetical protein Ct9H300mP23_03010 [Nitrospinota bacterium]
MVAFSILVFNSDLLCLQWHRKILKRRGALFPGFDDANKNEDEDEVLSGFDDEEKFEFRKTANHYYRGKLE